MRYTNMKMPNHYVLGLITVLLCLINASAQATQPFLEDFDASAPPAANPNSISIRDDLWPRIMMAETQSFGGVLEQYSKYSTIAASAHSIDRVAELQRTYPQIRYFRTINPSAFLGFNDETFDRQCPQGHGNPFSRTTQSTGNCGVFAGHWLYQAGSTSTNALTATSTNLRVNDITRFSRGEFIVIYNAPAGSFNNAEHAKITGVNTSTRTLTIERGFKSTATAHAAGSVVAQHVRDAGGDTRNWFYNISTQAPRDSNNRRYDEFLPIWVSQNFNRNLIGELSTAEVSGFLFDVDHSFLFNFIAADANNDLITDNGISPNGTNWWGEGLRQFYARMRSRFPNAVIVGGVRDARGFDDLNGTQMEGFPSQDNFSSPTPEYENLAALLSTFSFHLKHRSVGPAHSHALSRTPTRTYPFNANPAPSNNRNFRFALGLTLLDEGYFGFQNTSTFRDIWFDEYAVDITRGSATYGHAVPSNHNDEARVRAHVGWLGRPLGPRQRLYSDSQFAPQRSLVNNGTFDSNINDWEGINVNVSRSTSIVQDGSGALRASGHTGGYQGEFFEAAIRGQSVNVRRNQSYTFTFSARASEKREISVQAGGHTERFLLRPQWQRFVMTFTPDRNQTARLRFNLGRENSQVWVDSIGLFEGDANVFRRDFDHGIVVVNATPRSRTIPLDGTFRHINGQQDRQFNDGSIVSTITLPAHESAILVRLEQDQPQTDVQPPWIVVNAPTKTRVGPINNTTIVVRDQRAINANRVRLSPDNTAGVANFDCRQTNVRQVNCTLSITRSGDLKLIANDTAGNTSTENEIDYRINGGTTGDGQIPLISITAPTRTSNRTITDTTVQVTDNEEIRAADVQLRDNNTAGVTNFNCRQAGRRTVNCTLNIVRSGDLRLMATDVAGNVHLAGVSNYVINNNQSGDTTRPSLTINAPTKNSNRSIIDTTILVTDDTGIAADNVRLRASTTAGARNFECRQDGSRSVRCTVNIISSGDLVVSATDNAGNERFRTERDYVITRPSADNTRAFFIVDAPTKVSNRAIRDTQITVRDNVAINASNVLLRSTTSAETSDFQCQQRRINEVSCSIVVRSSGDLNFIATDRAGNITFRAERDYIITPFSSIGPIIQLLLSNDE